MLTARDLADRVRRMRMTAWDTADPTIAVVSTNQLNPEDEQAVRRAIATAGLHGREFEEMVIHVSAILVGQVIALDDNQPVDASA